MLKVRKGIQMSTGTAQFGKSTAAVKSSSKKKSRKKAKKNNVGLICGVVLGVMVASLGIAYISGRAYYGGKFLNDTFINGTDVSGMTYEEACKAVGADKKDPDLVITGIDGKKFEIPAKDFGYTRNAADEVKKLYEQVNHGAWFSGYAGKTDLSYTEQATYDAAKLEKLLDEQEWGDTETADAYMELTDEGYVINKEIQGNKITDMQQLYYVVESDLSGGEFEITLDENSGCYAVPEIKSGVFEEQCAALNNVFNISITYDFNYTTETLTGKRLLEILDMDDMGNYSVDEDKAMEYVEYLADKYDTYNKPRKFHATLQGDITVEPSSDAKYGWWIYQQATCDELVDMLEDGVSVESVEPVYVEDYPFVYKGLPSARTANDDIGKTYVEIDLTDQHLWYYKNGKLDYECYIVSGQTTSAARTTLEGVYKLWSKETNKRMKDSNADGEEWDTTCNYWNNVSLCGIGLHDSTWRGAFGGTIYQWNGSHGCINMPYEGAQYIYENVELETPVVMYY